MNTFVRTFLFTYSKDTFITNKLKSMLKYRIDELLQASPNYKVKMTYNWLPAQLGVTPKTWREWKKIRVQDTATIPGEKLFQIASFFECKPEELFTIKPEPITYVKPEFNAQKIAEI